MKKLDFYIKYLESKLATTVESFVLSERELEEDESPIEEASYYKGFLDAIHYLSSLQRNNANINNH